MPDQHPELASEQRYLDAAYARLDAMRRAAERVAAGYSEVRQGGTHQARLERDAADALTRRRLAALDIGDAPLCFGRLDMRGDDGDPRFYVGRIAVFDEEQAPLVIDWRAPVAEPFYRATAIAPLGVVRRRHFNTRPGNGRDLVGLDDEVFDTEAASSAGLTVVGEGALLAAIDRARTGRMTDIVATIQIEQDEAIRAELRRRAHRRGRPRDGQDGRRAPPRGLPPLHAPEAPRIAGRAPRGPQHHLPALHRPGPPVARRGRGPARHALGAQAAVPRRVGGRARGGADQGRRPDGAGRRARDP